MAARVRDHAWEHSPLGIVATWPQSLRTAVEIMLALPRPAALQWGKDDVLLFNDPFSRLLDRDPAAVLGTSGQDRQELVPWREKMDVTAIPVHDEAGHAAGTLSIFREDPGRAAELARLNESLSANIAERSHAEDERKALQRYLAAAEEAERGRISRELHDQLGQHLTAIALGLHEVAGLVRPGSVARERLSALQELTSLLTRDARYLAIELRPPELDDVGLESAMASYVEQWSLRYGIVAELQSTGVVRFQYGGDVATAIYRVLQEALTNVAKHARATQVSVILEHTDGELRLIVEDDGDGFDVDTTLRRATADRRLGLLGMRERASLLGGTLTAESSPGKGTSLFVRVPVR